MPHPSASILVAEDSALQRKLFGELLRGEGFIVHEAADGSAALDLCRSLRPDLLVLDLQLPGLGADEILARLRADPKVSETVVLVLAPDARDSTVAPLLEHGASDCLAKPPGPLELVACVRGALRECVPSRGADVSHSPGPDATGAGERDPLTGLPNRQGSIETLAVAVRRARGHGRSVAVALLGVDDLPRIADKHGQAAEQRLMCALAGRLNDRCRYSDTVGRWSDEQFVAVLPDASPALAGVAAESLRRAAAATELRLSDELALPVTVSVGWACSADASPEQLMEMAALALDEARSGGGNQVAAAGYPPAWPRAGRPVAEALFLR